MRYEEKTRIKKSNSLMKICWQEKGKAEKKELYSREKANYYNKKEWAVEAIEDVRENEKDKERMLIERERNIQRVVDISSRCKDKGSKIQL